MLKQDEVLVNNYIEHYGVTKIPTGHTVYGPGEAPITHRASLLIKRHKRTRQMYRDLTAHGFDKWEIAKLMQVSLAQVRVAVNAIGMIQELKGYGQCHTQ